MPTSDTRNHKRAGGVVLSEEDRGHVEAIAGAHDLSDDDAAAYLLERGWAACQDDARRRHLHSMPDGATLVLTKTKRGREYGWLHRRTGTGWVVAYRLVPKGGRPVVAELRVFPDDGTLEAGGDGSTWSGDEDRVPMGGLPGRVVRSEVRVVDDTALVGKGLKRFRQHFGEAAAVFGVGLAERLAPLPAPRKGVGNPRRVALVAAAYAEAVDAGSRTPAKDAAARLGLNVRRVHEQMNMARDNGLFVGLGQGRPGGYLTARGKAALVEAGEA